MKARITGLACAAMLMTASMVVFAQATERAQSPSPQPPAASAPQQERANPPSAEPQTTLVGCVAREADYRKAQAAGKGGAAGTGVGGGNEFILTNAARSMAGATPADPAAPRPDAGAVGTAGASGDAYELTGPAEGKLEQYVGRRVEIVGKVKSGADAAAAGRPAGGAIAGQELNLKEFEVVSVKEATGTCPSAK
jgi:hypothetical protein